MRIFFLGNNWVAWKVACWLKEQGDEIVGVAIHPPAKRRYANEILQTFDLPDSRVFDGSSLRQPVVAQAIERLDADVALSVLFDYILRAEFIDLFPDGVVNLHPSFLPYNRGANPNVWSIVEGTPAGVTLHYIDSGIDTGDIIAQRNVEVEPVDTGQSLYHRLEHACLELFAQTWPLVRGRCAPRTQQSGGTYHRASDVADTDEIFLNHTYTAGELIDHVRARTFPPYQGVYFRANGRKVFLRLQLLDEKDLDNELPTSTD